MIVTPSDTAAKRNKINTPGFSDNLYNMGAPASGASVGSSFGQAGAANESGRPNFGGTISFGSNAQQQWLTVGGIALALVAIAWGIKAALTPKRRRRRR